MALKKSKTCSSEIKQPNDVVRAKRSYEQREAMTTQTHPIGGLTPFVRRQMAKIPVPGFGLAVVSGSEHIYQRCFGFGDIGQGTPLSPTTPFSIGSTGKSFTAAAAGILADQGLLDFDSPVRTYLPEFTLHRSIDSDAVTVRDLMCHRAGLPAHDMVWYRDILSRKQLLRRLRYLEPTAALRQKWQYSNLMYFVVGAVIEEISGESFDAFLREHLFQPLGMYATGPMPSSPSKQTAVGHNLTCDGTYKPVRRDRDPIMTPCGEAVLSNLEDMSRWLTTNINGRRGVSPLVLHELHRPQIAMPGIVPCRESIPHSYGFGWVISTYADQPWIFHRGYTNGTVTWMSILPRQSLGIIAYANMDPATCTNGVFLSAITSFYVFDKILGRPLEPWSQRYRSKFGLSPNRTPKQPSPNRSERGAIPQNLCDYAGSYHHPAYGDLTLVFRQGGLFMVFRGETSRLRWQGVNECIARILYDDFHIHFGRRRSGSIRELTVLFDPPVSAVFKKRSKPNKGIQPTK